MTQRVVFGRIGWLPRYNGVREGRPKGGGSYNKTNLGNEFLNFASIKGRLYGFFRAGKKTTNIDRIQPGVTQDKVDGVLVVFVAVDPTRGGQKVVGWYENATIYRSTSPRPRDIKDGGPAGNRRMFCVEADIEKACLIPTELRECPVPSGREAMGTSNVAYCFDASGKRTWKPWMQYVLKYVQNYEGPNVLRDETCEAEQVEAAELVIETAAGFETNPQIKSAVEKHAMKLARRHFKKRGFSVEDRFRPYDLLCTKGTETKYVEVKGTRSLGHAVAMTKNEVDFLNTHSASSVLFVVHSIKVKGTPPRASRGSVRLLEPWDSSQGELKPINYFFRFNS